MILSEKLTNFCVTSSEILKLRELGVNEISQFRTEDSEKYLTLLSTSWCHSIDLVLKRDKYRKSANCVTFL